MPGFIKTYPHTHITSMQKKKERKKKKVFLSNQWDYKPLLFSKLECGTMNSFILKKYFVYLFFQLSKLSEKKILKQMRMFTSFNILLRQVIGLHVIYIYIYICINPVKQILSKIHIFLFFTCTLTYNEKILPFFFPWVNVYIFRTQTNQV